MSIRKIDKKYCLGNRAQLMLIRANNQAVFSKDGIKYLRVPISENNIVVIHKYLDDKDRKFFPYHDVPVSKRQHNHVFDCNVIYADVTCAGEFSSLNFKLFKRQDTNDILVEELQLNNFESEESEFMVDTDSVRIYLARQSDEKSRIIFDMWRAVNSTDAIRYVSSIDCEHLIDKLNIPLDNDSILLEYNRKNEPIVLFPSSSDITEENSGKKSIDEVGEFSLTEMGLISPMNPLMIIVKNDGTMLAKIFDIRFIRPNEFLIRERKYNIAKESFKIEHGITFDSIAYTGDPDIKTGYRPNQQCKLKKFRKRLPFFKNKKND